MQQDEETRRNISVLISKEGGSLIDKVRQLIRLFVTEQEISPEAKENEVLYMLIGFLTKSVPFDIQVEPKISVEYPNLRPDLIISDGVEKLVLELKRSKISTTKTVLPQMASYLKLTKIRQALVFQFSAENIKKELNSKVHELSIGGQLYTVEIMN